MAGIPRNTSSSAKCCVVKCCQSTDVPDVGKKPVMFFSRPNKKQQPEAHWVWAQLVLTSEDNSNTEWFVCSKHFRDGKPTQQNPYPTLNLDVKFLNPEVRNRIITQQQKSSMECCFCKSTISKASKKQGHSIWTYLSKEKTYQAHQILKNFLLYQRQVKEGTSQELLCDECFSSLQQYAESLKVTEGIEKKMKSRWHRGGSYVAKDKGVFFKEDSKFISGEEVGPHLEAEVRSEFSLLVEKVKSEYPDLYWLELLPLLKKDCPLLTSALFGLVCTKVTNKEMRSLLVSAMVSMSLFHNQPSFSKSFQEINTLAMWPANCKPELFARFSKFGLCLGEEESVTFVEKVTEDLGKGILQKSPEEIMTLFKAKQKQQPVRTQSREEATPQTSFESDQMEDFHEVCDDEDAVMGDTDASSFPANFISFTNLDDGNQFNEIPSRRLSSSIGTEINRLGVVSPYMKDIVVGGPVKEDEIIHCSHVGGHNTRRKGKRHLYCSQCKAEADENALDPTSPTSSVSDEQSPKKPRISTNISNGNPLRSSDVSLSSPLQPNSSRKTQSKKKFIPTKFHCFTCLNRFPTRNKLRAHELLHFARCEICNEKYIDVKGLKAHFDSHTGQTVRNCMHGCEYDSLFKTEKEWLEHDLKHLEENLKEMRENGEELGMGAKRTVRGESSVSRYDGEANRKGKESALRERRGSETVQTDLILSNKEGSTDKTIFHKPNTRQRKGGILANAMAMKERSNSVVQITKPKSRYLDDPEDKVTEKQNEIPGITDENSVKGKRKDSANVVSDIAEVSKEKTVKSKQKDAPSADKKTKTLSEKGAKLVNEKEKPLRGRKREAEEEPVIAKKKKVRVPKKQLQKNKRYLLQRKKVYNKRALLKRKKIFTKSRMRTTMNLRSGKRSKVPAIPEPDQNKGLTEENKSETSQAKSTEAVKDKSARSEQRESKSEALQAKSAKAAKDKSPRSEHPEIKSGTPSEKSPKAVKDNSSSSNQSSTKTSPPPASAGNAKPSMHFALKSQQAKPLGCPFCRQRFSTPEAREDHTKEHPAQITQCLQCKMVFYKDSPNVLKKHEKVHREDAAYACKICNCKFFSLNVLMLHQHVHKMGKDYLFRCRYCKEVFSELRQRDNHIIELHSKRKNEKGKIEEKTTTSSDETETASESSPEKNDTPVEFDERELICRFCGKLFASKTELDSHVPTHQRKQVFRCVCQKAFLTRAGLESHQQITDHFTKSKRSGRSNAPRDGKSQSKKKLEDQKLSIEGEKRSDKEEVGESKGKRKVKSASHPTSTDTNIEKAGKGSSDAKKKNGKGEDTEKEAKIEKKESKESKKEEKQKYEPRVAPELKAISNMQMMSRSARVRSKMREKQLLEGAPDATETKDEKMDKESSSIGNENAEGSNTPLSGKDEVIGGGKDFDDKHDEDVIFSSSDDNDDAFSDEDYIPPEKADSLTKKKRYLKSLPMGRIGEDKEIETKEDAKNRTGLSVDEVLSVESNEREGLEPENKGAEQMDKTSTKSKETVTDGKEVIKATHSSKGFDNSEKGSMESRDSSRGTAAVQTTPPSKAPEPKKAKERILSIPLTKQNKANERIEKPSKARKRNEGITAGIQKGVLEGKESHQQKTLLGQEYLEKSSSSQVDPSKPANDSPPQRKIDLTTQLAEQDLVTLYKCMLCQKFFQNVEDLGEHLTTHSGLKSYYCRTCKQRFSDILTLLAHLGSHNMEDSPSEGTDKTDSRPTEKESEGVNSESFPIKKGEAVCKSASMKPKKIKLKANVKSKVKKKLKERILSAKLKQNEQENIVEKETSADEIMVKEKDDKLLELSKPISSQEKQRTSKTETTADKTTVEKYGIPVLSKSISSGKKSTGARHRSMSFADALNSVNTPSTLKKVKKKGSGGISKQFQKTKKSVHGTKSVLSRTSGGKISKKARKGKAELKAKLNKLKKTKSEGAKLKQLIRRKINVQSKRMKLPVEALQAMQGFATKEKTALAKLLLEERKEADSDNKEMPGKYTKSVFEALKTITNTKTNALVKLATEARQKQSERKKMNSEKRQRKTPVSDAIPLAAHSDQNEGARNNNYTTDQTGAKKSELDPVVANRDIAQTLDSSTGRLSETRGLSMEDSDSSAEIDVVGGVDDVGGVNDLEKLFKLVQTKGAAEQEEFVNTRETHQVKPDSDQKKAIDVSADAKSAGFGSLKKKPQSDSAMKKSGQKVSDSKLDPKTHKKKKKKEKKKEKEDKGEHHSKKKKDKLRSPKKLKKNSLEKTNTNKSSYVIKSSNVAQAEEDTIMPTSHFCKTCKRKFRQPQDLLKHVQTLNHVAEIQPQVRLKKLDIDKIQMETATRVSDGGKFPQAVPVDKSLQRSPHMSPTTSTTFVSLPSTSDKVPYFKPIQPSPTNQGKTLLPILPAKSNNGQPVMSSMPSTSNRSQSSTESEEKKAAQKKTVYKCVLCKITLGSAVALGKHLSKHSVGASSNMVFSYLCKTCKKKFSSVDDLMSHLNSCHKKTSAPNQVKQRSMPKGSSAATVEAPKKFTSFIAPTLLQKSFSPEAGISTTSAQSSSQLTTATLTHITRVISVSSVTSEDKVKLVKVNCVATTPLDKATVQTSSSAAHVSKSVPSIPVTATHATMAVMTKNVGEKYGMQSATDTSSKINVIQKNANASQENLVDHPSLRSPVQIQAPLVTPKAPAVHPLHGSIVTVPPSHGTTTTTGIMTSGLTQLLTSPQVLPPQVVSPPGMLVPPMSTQYLPHLGAHIHLTPQSPFPVFSSQPLHPTAISASLNFQMPVIVDLGMSSIYPLGTQTSQGTQGGIRQTLANLNPSLASVASSAVTNIAPRPALQAMDLVPPASRAPHHHQVSSASTGSSSRGRGISSLQIPAPTSKIKLVEISENHSMRSAQVAKGSNTGLQEKPKETPLLRVTSKQSSNTSPEHNKVKVTTHSFKSTSSDVSQIMKPFPNISSPASAEKKLSPNADLQEESDSESDEFEIVYMSETKAIDLSVKKDSRSAIPSHCSNNRSRNESQDNKANEAEDKTPVPDSNCSVSSAGQVEGSNAAVRLLKEPHMGKTMSSGSDHENGRSEHKKNVRKPNKVMAEATSVSDKDEQSLDSRIRGKGDSILEDEKRKEKSVTTRDEASKTQEGTIGSVSDQGGEEEDTSEQSNIFASMAKFSPLNPPKGKSEFTGREGKLPQKLVSGARVTEDKGKCGKGVGFCPSGSAAFPSASTRDVRSSEKVTVGTIIQSALAVQPMVRDDHQKTTLEPFEHVGQIRLNPGQAITDQIKNALSQPGTPDSTLRKQRGKSVEISRAEKEPPKLRDDRQLCASDSLTDKEQQITPTAEDTHNHHPSGSSIKAAYFRQDQSASSSSLEKGPSVIDEPRKDQAPIERVLERTTDDSPDLVILEKPQAHIGSLMESSPSSLRENETQVLQTTINATKKEKGSNVTEAKKITPYNQTNPTRDLPGSIVESKGENQEVTDINKKQYPPLFSRNVPQVQVRFSSISAVMPNDLKFTQPTKSQGCVSPNSTASEHPREGDNSCETVSNSSSLEQQKAVNSIGDVKSTTTTDQQENLKSSWDLNATALKEQLKDGISNSDLKSSSSIEHQANAKVGEDMYTAASIEQQNDAICCGSLTTASTEEQGHMLIKGEESAASTEQQEGVTFSADMTSTTSTEQYEDVSSRADMISAASSEQPKDIIPIEALESATSIKQQEDVNLSTDIMPAASTEQQDNIPIEGIESAAFTEQHKDINGRADTPSAASTEHQKDDILIEGLEFSVSTEQQKGITFNADMTSAASTEQLKDVNSSADIISASKTEQPKDDTPPEALKSTASTEQEDVTFKADMISTASKEQHEDVNFSDNMICAASKEQQDDSPTEGMESAAFTRQQEDVNFSADIASTASAEQHENVNPSADMICAASIEQQDDIPIQGMEAAASTNKQEDVNFSAHITSAASAEQQKHDIRTDGMESTASTEQQEDVNSCFDSISAASQETQERIGHRGKSKYTALIDPQENFNPSISLESVASVEHQDANPCKDEIFPFSNECQEDTSTCGNQRSIAVSVYQGDTREDPDTATSKDHQEEDVICIGEVESAASEESQTSVTFSADKECIDLNQNEKPVCSVTSSDIQDDADSDLKQIQTSATSLDLLKDVSASDNMESAAPMQCEEKVSLVRVLKDTLFEGDQRGVIPSEDIESSASKEHQEYVISNDGLKTFDSIIHPDDPSSSSDNNYTTPITQGNDSREVGKASPMECPEDSNSHELKSATSTENQGDVNPSGNVEYTASIQHQENDNGSGALGSVASIKFPLAPISNKDLSFTSYDKPLEDQKHKQPSSVKDKGKVEGLSAGEKEYDEQSKKELNQMQEEKVDTQQQQDVSAVGQSDKLESFNQDKRGVTEPVELNNEELGDAHREEPGKSKVREGGNDVEENFESRPKDDDDKRVCDSLVVDGLHLSPSHQNQGKGKIDPNFYPNEEKDSVIPNSSEANNQNLRPVQNDLDEDEGTAGSALMIHSSETVSQDSSNFNVIEDLEEEEGGNLSDFGEWQVVDDVQDDENAESS